MSRARSAHSQMPLDADCTCVTVRPSVPRGPLGLLRRCSRRLRCRHLAWSRAGTERLAAAVWFGAPVSGALDDQPSHGGGGKPAGLRVMAPCPALPAVHRARCACASHRWKMTSAPRGSSGEPADSDRESEGSREQATPSANRVRHRDVTDLRRGRRQAYPRDGSCLRKCVTRPGRSRRRTCSRSVTGWMDT
jgi:hypothetical protein